MKSVTPKGFQLVWHPLYTFDDAAVKWPRCTCDGPAHEGTPFGVGGDPEGGVVIKCAGCKGWRGVRRHSETRCYRPDPGWWT